MNQSFHYYSPKFASILLKNENHPAVYSWIWEYLTI